MEVEVIKVKMADLNVGIVPNRLKTTGLGSCVGIVLYDALKKVGGMAHIMLPSSEMVKIGEINKAKYADTAIPILIDKLIELGARKSNIVAKLAGGAQMFQFNAINDMMKVGPRNVEASKKILNEIGIPIVSEDTGGNYGRTIELDIENGILYIKTTTQGVIEI